MLFKFPENKQFMERTDESPRTFLLLVYVQLTKYRATQPICAMMQSLKPCIF